MNYKVSDFIIRIKNAGMARRRKVNIPYSKMVEEIGSVLVKAGFLESIKEKEVDGKKILETTVKFSKRSPVIEHVYVISKPSLRVYTTVKNIPEMQRKDMNTIVLSTSKGIMMGRDAYKKRIGGEVLFKII